MLRTSSILYAIIFLSVPNLGMASCDEDTIETISDSGDLIILTSGLAFDVLPGDDATASTWLENEDVLIRKDVIINKDQHGEKIEVTPH